MQRGETLEEEIRRQGMLDPSSVWWVWSGSLNGYTRDSVQPCKGPLPHMVVRTRTGSGPWAVGLLCSSHFRRHKFSVFVQAVCFALNILCVCWAVF